MSSIIRKMSAFKKKRHTVEIGGAEFHFYPVRMRRLLTGDIKAILLPIYEAVQVLFRSTKYDQEIIEEASPDGVIARQIKPPSESMVQMRSRQRQEAIQAAMDIIFKSETRYDISLLILDSLRDENDGKRPTQEEAAQFVDSDWMDLPTFFEFFKGFLGANTAIFGDLGNLVGERVKSAISKMTAPEPEETGPDDLADLADLDEMGSLDEDSSLPL